MKQRYIRGVSSKPFKRVSILSKALGQRTFGLMPAACPMCKKIVYLLPYKVQECPHCGQCRIGFSKDDQEIAYSAAFIEQWSLSVAFKLPQKAVLDWCDRNIINARWRVYLSLDHQNMTPLVGGFPVTTKNYNNTLRYIMFLLVTTERKHLRFLVRQNTDMRGLQYLAYPTFFIETFSPLGRYDQERAAVTTGDLERYMFRPTRVRDTYALRPRLLDNMAQMVDEFSEDIFGDHDENA